MSTATKAQTRTNLERCVWCPPQVAECSGIYAACPARPRPSGAASAAVNLAVGQGLLQLDDARGRYLPAAEEVQLLQPFEGGQLLQTRVRHLLAAEVQRPQLLQGG